MKIHPGEVIGFLAGIFLLAAMVWGRSWTAPTPPSNKKSRVVLLEGQLWSGTPRPVARRKVAPKPTKSAKKPAKAPKRRKPALLMTPVRARPR